MTKQEKEIQVAELTEKFNSSNFLYVVDTGGLNAIETTTLRRNLHKAGVSMRVAKNTLIKRAMQNSSNEYGELMDTLKGTSAIMFTEDAKSPAKTIKAFRAKKDKPILKGAYIDSDLFIGDENLTALTELKSKEDLIGEIITILQSPLSNVMSALKSGGNNLTGILKTLEERNK